MASEDYISFSGEGGEFEVMDEVADGQFESEDGGTKGLRNSLCFNKSETDLKIQTFTKQELVTEREVSENIESTPKTVSQICKTTEIDATGNMTPDKPVTTEVCLETNVTDTTAGFQKTIQTTKDGNDCEKKVDVTGASCVLSFENVSEKDGVKLESTDQDKSETVESLNIPCSEDDKIMPLKESIEPQNNSDVKIEIAGSPKSQLVIDVKLNSEKESKKMQLEVDNTKTKTVKETMAKLADDLWDKHELIVRGLPPGKAGELKQLLNTTLGNGSHRIRPRVKGDTILHVLFKCKDQMQIAHKLLHNHNFMNFRMTAEMLNKPVKRKAQLSESGGLPSAKKVRQEPIVLRFLEGTYDEQVTGKMEDVILKLRKVARHMLCTYPDYGGLINQRLVKNGGIICCLDKFLTCPVDERFETWCKFSIRRDDEQGEPRIGFNAGNGSFLDMNSVKHNYPAHVVEAAKVFEKVIEASEKALADPDGRKELKFWRELIIRTNETQDLMFLVFVYCPEDLAEDRIPRLRKELTEFFNSEEGKNCQVTSVYTKVFYNLGLVAEQSELAAGSPYLEQTILGLTLHLVPNVLFWKNAHAAKMICRGVEELLAPTKRISVLEICCGHGLIGLYLSKSVGEVLCIDREHIVEEAKKNAELNEITNCHYFGGKPDEVVPQLSSKISFDKACAIIILGSHISSTSCSTAMFELRRIEKLRRLVLVTEIFSARFTPVMTLSKPSNERGTGNPFFPVRVIPVDSMPRSRGYVLLILMERIGLQSLPKSPDDLAIHIGMRGPGTVTKTKMPYERENVQMTKSSWDQKNFLNKRQENKRMSGPRGDEGLVNMFANNPTRQGQFQNMMFGNNNEFHLGQMMAEERRQMEEEEEEIRWRQEEHRRKMEEEEHKRRMEEEEHRTRMEQHRRRMEEDEQRRQMEVEEHRKRLQEERRRHMEEERELRAARNRNRGSVVQDLISETFRDAALPQISEQTAHKLKQVITEVIKSVGVLEQEDPERELQSEDDRSFQRGYSRQTREFDAPGHSRNEPYEGNYARPGLIGDSYHQEAIAPQRNANRNMINQAKDKPQPLLGLKLRGPAMGNQNEGAMYVRHVDLGTQEPNITFQGYQQQDSYTRNEPQVARRNWNTSTFMSFSDARKEPTCSTPKPPGTEEMYYPGSKTCFPVHRTFH